MILKQWLLVPSFFYDVRVRVNLTRQLHWVLAFSHTKRGWRPGAQARAGSCRARR